MILQAIRQRAGILGVAVSWLAGAAWTVITWLAVPIIIVEGVGPIEAIKRSSHLLKQTWGENVIAQVGLGAVGFAAMLPGMIVAGAAGSCRRLDRAVPALVRDRRHRPGAAPATARPSTAPRVGLPAGEGFSQETLSAAFAPKGESGRFR